MKDWGAVDKGIVFFVPSILVSFWSHLFASLLVSLETYMSQFQWDEAKYKLNSPLKDITEAISLVCCPLPLNSAVGAHVCCWPTDGLQA